MKIARKACKWSGRLLVAVGLLTLLAIATPVDSWWARAYSGPIDRPQGDILILLSAAADDQGTISYSSYWRARYAVLVWQTGVYKKIVVSGGGGPGIQNFLLAEGIPQESLLAEWRSQSTRESGIELARMLSQMPGTKVLLTSDFHMYRAFRTFRKLGIEVKAMPIPDALKSAEQWNGRLQTFQTMSIETAKIAYYRIRGWI